MKIVIDPFDKKSISEAIAMLKQYKQDFAEKEAQFVKRLKDIGVTVATSGFANAQYDGVNDVVVTGIHNGNRATIIAHGQTVGFIEFGTGVRNREWNGFGVEYVPPAHGTYGKGKGKQPYGWWFTPAEGGRGKHTYGNPPAEAMLQARDTMIERVAQIAREVWK